MIVGFNILDEELVYSAGARFQALMDYPNREIAVLELFGTQHALATTDLPVHLGHLAAAMPPGHPYTVDRLIDEHTLYPVYAAFLPTERAEKVRAAMEADGSTSAHAYTGMFRTGVRSPTWFRYCPDCVTADRDRDGEAYWHRVHQVPGVLVCPDHSMFLEDSTARARTPARLHEFVPAEAVVAVVTPRPLNPDDASHVKLARLATDAQWILRNQKLLPDPKDLHGHYLDLLADRGYISHAATVQVGNFKRVLDDVIAFYSPALLEQLQCPLNVDRPRTWLHRVLEPPRKARHPLHHLLLMQFLGVTAESLACRPPRPRSMRDLREDGSSDEIDENEAIKVPAQADRVKHFRSRLLSLIDELPGASREDLLRRLRHDIQWLRKHDQDWLEATLPSRKPRVGPSRDFGEYWRQRDAELVSAVVDAAAAIRQSDGAPQRVSTSSIARQIGEFHALHRGSAYLPRTTAELDRLTESEQDFAIRRISWATELFRQEGFTPTLSNLMVRAGLRQHVGIGLVPAVRVAAETAFATLPPRPIILKGRWANAR